MTEPYLFEVNDLCRYFPAKKNGVVKAVDGVSFRIRQGETFSLVGESGCGKTTCGRTLLGVYPKTAGSILWKGRETCQLTRAELKQFKRENQMIFQDPYSCLDPRMTIGTIIQEGMRVHFDLSAHLRDQRVAELLFKVGLTADFASRFPHELSGGQRQRVGIARALAMEPSFIVCDEPIAALDVSIQAQVVNLMIDLQQDLGLTYLFISHDLSMVRHISDRIGVMYLGTLVEVSDTDPLYSRPMHPYTQALFSAIPAVGRRQNGKRIRLEGEIPSPMDPPPGCRFSSRCPHAAAQCRQTPPVLRELEPGHLVACHRAEELNG
ncbi:MAG: ATP-binding cassette domain-containing protein [Clostridia bacterium]|nr:ATP-binding cassette domain-containing protein [Clostridia bacterium]